ncbi:MAG: UDP-N-acetylmuramoyl-L-alanine--D-glutamate ligase [Firmicutes bacterium]|nr:UDP-N-acetylmuramoyl-L-alanine--D-glutamate ligase [Bacillota bacterium]
MYENKKILILGAARSGIAVAKLLAKYNNDIVLSDVVEIDYKIKNELENLGIKVITGEDQISLLDDGYDLIIKNPAIMYTSKLTKKMQELNLRVENEMEVAYHFLPKNCFIIGITGSNGKTTTTTILYELLKRSEKKVVLGGNIGTPLSDLVLNVQENDILLLEISDHQLVDFNDFKTNISLLTNICPTHLDYHGNYEHYMLTKKKIFNNHTSLDLAIINEENADSLKITNNLKAKKIYFNNEVNYINEIGIFVNNELIIKLEDILLKGKHNYDNILAALIILNEFGIDKDVVKEFLQSFGGVEHRLEFVAEKNKVKFYNDSKATNPTATITALKTFNDDIHLILGGQERNQDFHELDDYMQHVKYIYAIGTVTKRVKEYANEINIPCFLCFDLKTALEKIKENMQENEIVLLSTASASQDFYAKFEDRGNEFKNLVAKI